MARGRFISRAISLDEKVNSLSNDTARLLFTWLITHLDCEGRMHGDARTVASVVFPRRATPPARIEKYLKEMETLGLILRYRVNGNQYLCMKTFEKHQPGLRKDRESASQIPPFTPDLIRSNDGFTPAQVKVKVKVKDTIKGDTNKEVTVDGGESQSQLVSTSLQKALDIYQEEIGQFNPVTDSEVESTVKKYGEVKVIDAIKVAVTNGRRTWDYVEGVLRKWEKTKP